jgi:hypothetical protein
LAAAGMAGICRSRISVMMRRVRRGTLVVLQTLLMLQEEQT